MVSRARGLRISHEVKEFEKRPPWGISIRPEKEDVYDVLLVCLQGPKGSPYEGGTFKVTVTIPDTYPFEPPLLKFTTPVYHPNIDKGKVLKSNMITL